MEWDMGDGSDGSSDDSLSGSAISDADAAGLGMEAQPAEFYDAEADDRNEAWVQKMRRAEHSDAILSCPLCFTTLCIECQQHEKFENQFRAMFVMNCRVKTGEAVALPQPPGKTGKKLKQEQRRQKRQQERRQQEQDAAAAEQQQRAAAATQQQQHPQEEQQQGAAEGATAEEQQATMGQPSEHGAAPEGREQQAVQGVQAPASEAQPAASPAPGTAAPAGPTAAAALGTAARADEEGQRMNPVCCAVCDTEVGLRDAAEGVYFFFNAFASNS